MTLGLSMSPPVGSGGGGGVFTPSAQHGLQEEDRISQRQQMSLPRSLASLDLSAVGRSDAGGASYSSELAPQCDGQEHQPQSAVGAVIAEVAARRSRRSAEPRQAQSRDTGGVEMDAEMMDMDVVHRGTPRSGGSHPMAQPRLLLSELDADGSGSVTAAGMYVYRSGELHSARRINAPGTHMHGRCFCGRDFRTLHWLSRESMLAPFVAPSFVH